MKRLVLACMLILCLTLVEGLAEPVDEMTFSYQGAVWGMTKDDVRALMGIEPYQEPVAESGHTALVYQIRNGASFCIVQYNFLPSGALYNIEIMAPDTDGTFYLARRDEYTALYGEALTASGASMHSENAAAVMMAYLMQNTGDTDFLGWQADDETVIVMSREPIYQVCYVEIRRYTDYFRFE